MPDPPRELTITRVLAAPREQVWRAWTEPEQLARWWGPKGLTTRRESIQTEVRPGGPFRLTMVSEHDGSTFKANGTFRLVQAPEMLVFVEPPAASDDDAIQVARVTFREVEPGRTQVALHAKLRLPAQLIAGAREGWGGAFDKLEQLFAGAEPQEAAKPQEAPKPQEASKAPEAEPPAARPQPQPSPPPDAPPPAAS